jgi:deoxycytidine triphosphate deaminase
MSILNATELRKRIKAGWLVVDASVAADGEPAVEAASYDLRAGIVLWKDKSSHELKTLYYESETTNQSVLTLSPGQMAFVITHEELNLSNDICGTVYSRNMLQKQNILALNAGHVDPGYRGPIMIRLINLRQIEWPLTLGEAVFTVVFHTVEPVDKDKPQDIRTKADTLLAARQTAAQAFSNPLHDLYTDELRKTLEEYKTVLLKDSRDLLSKEFFRKEEIWKPVVAGVGTLLAGFGVLVGLFKVPWKDVFHAIGGLFR